MTATTKQAVQYCDETVQETPQPDAMTKLVEKHGDKVKHSINTAELVQCANTGDKQDTRWKPGQSGNPSGRTLGAKNKRKLEAEFYSDLAADWNAHGPQAIIDLRQDNPVKYVQLVASVMPKTMEFDDSGSVRWVINATPGLSTSEWLESHSLPQPVDSQGESDD